LTSEVVGLALPCFAVLKLVGRGVGVLLGGGVVGGEGLRVFQYWYRPSCLKVSIRMPLIQNSVINDK
jgi:hypothetical protein